MGNTMLKGIRVIEMGTHVAIPICARELADLGAEVIKVETTKGEVYRSVGRLFQTPYEEDYNVMFEPYNLNKKSLPLNLKSEEGKEAFIKLLSTADVFITTTREMALERLGLGLESLREKFPSLIIGNVSGFGHKGPDKDRGGYDSTSFWSPSGAMVEWGYQDDNHVFRPFYGFGDAIAGAHLAVGVVTALFNRTRTGKGEVIRNSLLGAAMWQNVGGIMQYQLENKSFPKDFYTPVMPLDNYYKTKDGRWIICPEEYWDRRCSAYFNLFGTPWLADDPDWNTEKAYMTNIPEKVKYFQEHFAQVTSEEIVEALSAVDAVYEFLADPKDILDNPQVWEMNYLTKVPTLSGKDLIVSTLPLRFDDQPLSDMNRAPLLGENAKDLLKELGYSEEQIKSMAENNITVIR